MTPRKTVPYIGELYPGSEGTRPADGFLDLGRLGLVLELLIQGRSA